MANKLGILVAGYAGGVGSTITAGLDLMARELRPQLGMICTAPASSGLTIGDRLGVPDLADIVVSGWDTIDHSVEQALNLHEILSKADIAEVSTSVLAQRPMLISNITESQDDSFEWGKHIEYLRRDIKQFKIKHQLDHVVVVNCMSTQLTPAWSENYESLERFKTACANLDSSITASMAYACAAILESAAFVNFTPNIVAVPAIVKLATEKRVPLAGRDGKTGQTLLKTTLAPAFKLRALEVEGWFSTNILGNRDGEALNDPAACHTKIQSKESCLDEIMGYPVEDHQVHIHYYRPRRDNKESWDNIDLKGFLGYPMQIKVNFLCRDSILAAPLILDIARLMTVSLRNKEFGPLPHFALFFKSPEMPEGMQAEHDLFVQRNLLEKWVEQSEK